MPTTAITTLGKLLNVNQPAQVQVASVEALSALVKNYPQAGTLLRLDGGLSAALKLLHADVCPSQLAATIAELLARIAASTTVTMTYILKEKWLAGTLIQVLRENMSEPAAAVAVCELLGELVNSPKFAKRALSAGILETMRFLIAHNLLRLSMQVWWSWWSPAIATTHRSPRAERQLNLCSIKIMGRRLL